MTLLDVRDATVNFQGRRSLSGLFGERSVVHALRGVSLQVDEGETLGLVGESGCGKTTLARAIVGLEPLTSGEIRLDGELVAAGGWRRQLRAVRTCQMVFQDPYSSLNPKRRVRQIIGEPWEIHRTLAPPSPGTRVNELLEMVGLAATVADRYPHQLSGGQRQRVGIARALALEPRLLICDEPVSALDVSIQAQILQLLKSIQRELGLAYIVISHDLGVVRQISSRVAVLYLGRVVEDGDPAGVYERPAHPYTEALLQAIPDLYPWRRGDDSEEISSEVLAELPDPSAPPPGCSYANRCTYRTERCLTHDPDLSHRPDAPRPVACFHPLSAGTPDA